jgi:hypothetical protein
LDLLKAKEPPYQPRRIVVSFTMPRSEELEHGDGLHALAPSDTCHYCVMGTEPTPEEHAEEERQLAEHNAKPPQEFWS